MSGTRRCRRTILGLLAVIAACSSPTPVLYTIAPVQGQVQPGGPKVIVLQQEDPNDAWISHLFAGF